MLRREGDNHDEAEPSINWPGCWDRRPPWGQLVQYCTRRIPSPGGQSPRARRWGVLRLRGTDVGARAGVRLAQTSNPTATGGVPWAKSGRGPPYGRRGRRRTPTGCKRLTTGEPCPRRSTKTGKRARGQSSERVTWETSRYSAPGLRPWAATVPRARGSPPISNCQHVQNTDKDTRHKHTGLGAGDTLDAVYSHARS